MDRALIGTAVAVGLAASTAHAGPLTLQLGVGDGVGYASRAGAYRDDSIVELRGLLRHGCAGIEAGIAEDLERLEPSVELGGRYGTKLYVRAAAALVGATHLGRNYDLALGAGYARPIAKHVAWFAELDGIVRLGDVTTYSLRLTGGIAVPL